MCLWEVLCFCASSRSTFIGQIKDRPAVWAGGGDLALASNIYHIYGLKL